MEKSILILAFFCAITGAILTFIRIKGLKKEWSNSKLNFITFKLLELGSTFILVFYLIKDPDLAIISIILLIGIYVGECLKFIKYL